MGASEEASQGLEPGSAVQYRSWGGRDVLELVPQQVPTPGPGELLIRTRAAALNPKDVLVRLGRFRRMSGEPPITPGFDFCGDVVAASHASGGPPVGTRVFGMLGGMRGGALASYLCVPAKRVAVGPEVCDDATLAATPLAALTALQALRDLGGVRRGTAVCINGGSGGVGSFATQIARALGAQVTTLSSDGNRALCRSLGADSAVDYAVPDALADREFDVYFDVYGNGSLRSVRPLLASNGVYISTVPNRRNIRDHVLTRLSLGRRGRLVVVRHRSADLAWVSERLANGSLRALIDSVFDLADFDGAFERLESRHARGKVVIRFGESPAVASEQRSAL